MVSSRPAHGPGEESGGVPGFWSCLAWWWLVRPRSLLWAAVLVVAVVLAGGLAGVVLGGRSACEARTARALSEFGYVAERLQEKVTIRTLPVVSLATFVRQTPFFPELAEEFGSVAADLLRSEKAIANIQLVPGGVVSAVYPPGNEGALGHDLFRDPNRRGDLLRAVRGAPGMSISNPVVLMREGQSGRAIFARYPVFVDGPVANRTAEFGFDDAYDCGQLCYGDPGHVFWGLTTALVDFDTLLQFSGLTTLEEEEGVCFVLRTGRVFQATDLVSNNNTIYSSSCKATRPVVMVVSVPNDQWFLEIGYPGECTPWVLPAAIAVCAVTLGALVVLLLFVHQSLENRILAELRHASEVEQLQERQKQIAREEAGLGSDAIRLLVSSLSSVNTSPLPILRTFLKGNRDESLHGKIRSSTSFSASSIVMDPGLSMSVTNLARYGQGDVLVISKVYRLADMRSANPASCRSVALCPALEPSGILPSCIFTNAPDRRPSAPAHP